MKTKILAVLALIAALLGGDQLNMLGGTPGSLPASVATTSSVEVGKSVEVLFATTTGAGLCASRTISTVAAPILISSPGVAKGVTGTSSLQEGLGMLQAASTTVNYPSENFGCGAWIVTGVGGAGSTTIRIWEYRQ